MTAHHNQESKAHPAQPVNNFFHPNPKHLRAITRGFQGRTDDFALVRRAVPMPALLKFTGYPLASHQYCFRHKGKTGRALSIYRHESGGFWMFYCNNPECGITGDVVEFWFRVVQLAGRAPALWDRNYAAGDLLARLKSGQINPKLTELSDSCGSAGTPMRAREREAPLIAEIRTNLKQLGAMPSLPCKLRPKRLPVPLRIRVHDVIRALFPQNGLLLITPQVNWQSKYIRLRDDWLKLTPAQLAAHSFISTSYLTRADLNSSYPAFDKRRWLVIEDDSGSPLEQQFAIHTTLANLDAPLRCVCWSGGKSLHGWYLVEGWPETKCFELYAAAKGLGIRPDIAPYSIRQPVRLAGGWNAKTKQRQLIYLWNL
jgi:hypothetical protein